MRRSSTWRPGRSSATSRACRSTSGPTIPTTTRSPRGGRQIERRLHLLEPLRRRLREVPFGLDHPFWIEDPDFDLDFHVRHTAMPPPGLRRAARASSSPASSAGPLDRTPAAVGDLRHRGPARRPLRHPHQGPPRHHRRRVGRRAADDDARQRPRGRRRSSRRPRSGSPSRVPSDGEVLARAPRRASLRKPGRAPSCSRPARSRELGKATRNPVARRRRQPGRAASLRGRSARCSTSAGHRDAGARHRSARCRRSSRRARRSTRRSPPHRRFAFRSTSLDDGQGDQDRARRDRQRRRHGGVRRRAAHLAREPRRAARRAARRHGAGVDPHRRGDREVDEPGLGDLRRRCPTDEPDPVERVRAGARVDGRRRSSCSTPCRPTTLTDFAQFPPPAVFAPGDAHGDPASAGPVRDRR